MPGAGTETRLRLLLLQAEGERRRWRQRRRRRQRARSLESGAIKRPSYGVERERTSASGGDGAEGGKLASGWITAAAATFGSFL